MPLSLFKTEQIIRAASLADRQELANLIHFEARVHRHLDWRGPLDWLDASPYLVLEQRGEIQAAFASPAELPETAWIRLFAVGHDISDVSAWASLWPEALKIMKQDDRIKAVAVLPLSNWFLKLVQEYGFQKVNHVVMLGCSLKDFHPQKLVGETRVRPMNYDDLANVESIDHAAFEALWCNARTNLELAYGQAALATVAEVGDEVVGYQISTATPVGGHLARLAVLPDYQNQAIGSWLLQDLLAQFKRRGAQKITVNTQKDNHASLHLYQKMGFQLTGEEYPVFIYPLR